MVDSMKWFEKRVSTNFTAGEFLPRDAADYLNDPHGYVLKQGGWLLRVAEALRSQFGPTTINNWQWGGDFNARGIRLSEGLSNIGSQGSRHRKFMALDCHFKNVTIEQAHDHIRKNPEFWLKSGVVRYEKTQGGKPINWLHVDAGVEVYGFNA